MTEDDSLGELLAATKNVAAGRVHCSVTIGSALFADAAWVRVIDPEERLVDEKALTKRELDVLRLVKQGLSNKEIARCLILEESTIKNHLHRILVKLGVPSRRHAIRVAYDYGLL